MWEYTTLEVLQDFAKSPMQTSTIQSVIDHFGLTMYQIADQIRTASNLALVHGEQDYAFNSDELVWLGYCEAIAMCRGEGRNLFFAELKTEDEDYYIACAAIIKLFNCIFPENNQFVFKVGQGLVFGCKRLLNRTCKNNFCVTQLFKPEDMEECVYFLEEALCEDEESLPYTVMEYSPQEKRHENNLPKQGEVSQDYIQILREVQAFYGIDTSKEYIRYVESFAQTQGSRGWTYSDVCKFLQFVGETKDQSSYDILSDALTQEELTKRIFQISSSNDYESESILGFSPDVLLDAERLLNEMLKRDKPQG